MKLEDLRIENQISVSSYARLKKYFDNYSFNDNDDFEWDELLLFCAKSRDPKALKAIYDLLNNLNVDRNRESEKALNYLLFEDVDIPLEHQKLAVQLLDWGVSPRRSAPSTFSDSRDFLRDILFHEHLWQSNLKYLKEQKEHLYNRHLYEMLYTSSAYGKLEILQFLIENDSKCLIEPKWLESAMRYAVIPNKINTAQYLASQGAKVDRYLLEKNAPKCLEGDNPDFVHLFLSYGVEPEIILKNGGPEVASHVRAWLDRENLSNNLAQPATQKSATIKI